MAKLRVVGYQIQPVLMVDDGESLEAIPVDPVFVKAKDFASFDPEPSLAQIRAKVEWHEDLARGGL